MTIAVIGGLIGGVGLFQLGMMLVTDGLRLAAGKTLRNILENSTKTPIRGVLSGALITSMVQSSSAVTVAAIGFVNAGLMSLQQAVFVIYGSNIGTTMTSWLVAIIGFKLNIKAFALPAIGLGMMLRLLRGPGRQGAVGEALAGFGVFFMGIDVLKTSFEGLGTGIQLANFGGGGLTGVLLFVTIGFFLTLLMQSSSAALAIALTAAAGGVIPLQDAAAVVIGANVGTTSTAGLAVLGATPNAKRVAAAHVAFNIITGMVALLILPLLLKFLTSIRFLLGQDTGPVTILAMFHTLFNILGVVILWPLTRAMIRQLKGYFRSAEEDEAKPVYLDKNVIATPVLAMHALEKELERLGKIARRMAKGSLSTEISQSPQLVKDKAVFDQLEISVGDFVNRMQRSHLPAELDEALPSCLRITGYFASTTELAAKIAEKQGEIQPLQDEGATVTFNRFKGTVVKMFKASDVEQEDFSLETCKECLQAVIDEYHELKNVLLRATAQGIIHVRQLVALQDLISYMRRIAELTAKAARQQDGLTTFAELAQEDEPENETT